MDQRLVRVDLWGPSTNRFAAKGSDSDRVFSAPSPTASQLVRSCLSGLLGQLRSPVQFSCVDSTAAQSDLFFYFSLSPDLRAHPSFFFFFLSSSTPRLLRLGRDLWEKTAFATIACIALRLLHLTFSAIPSFHCCSSFLIHQKHKISKTSTTEALNLFHTPSFSVAH